MARKVEEAILAGNLHVPGQDSSPDTRTQHYKPDSVLYRRLGQQLEFRIIDTSGASDDKLIIEEEYTANQKFKSHVELERHMQSERFTGDGKPGQRVVEKVPPEDRMRAGYIVRFKQAHYSKRYQPLAEVIRNAGGRRKHRVEIRTIAFGVIGWIPKFTRDNISALFGGDARPKSEWGRAYESLVQDMITTILRYVAKGHRLWLKEKHC